MKTLYSMVLFVLPLLAFAGVDLASPVNQIFINVERGELVQVRDALEHNVNVNLANDFGETLLMRAAAAKQLAMVKLLLDNGADIRAKDRYGFTVLDILGTNIRQAGVNREKMVDAMRNQGLTDESITALLGDPKSGAKRFSEEDRRLWQEILDYIEAFEKEHS
jgi:hypothetical protein